MSIFDKFTKKKEPYSGDLSKTNILYHLLSIPKNNRDNKWNEQFLINISEASLRCSDPQVIIGPDGFPYFQLFLPIPNQEFQCFVIKYMANDFLIKKGLGVVINPNNGNPDWVFSYGDILNYYLKGEFYSKINPDIPTKTETLEKEQKVLVGQPSETILPKSTRYHIKQLLIKLGINNPKIFLMHRLDKGFQELVFNISPDKFKSYEEFENTMKLITWYLPRHYSICAMNEDEKTINNFMDL